MNRYVIFANESRTEVGLTSKLDWNASQSDWHDPAFKRDQAGVPMSLVLEFEAEDQEQASKQYHEWLDTGLMSLPALMQEWNEGNITRGELVSHLSYFSAESVRDLDLPEAIKKEAMETREKIKSGEATFVIKSVC